MIPPPAPACRRQATKLAMDANSMFPKAVHVVTAAQAAGRTSRRVAQVGG